MRKLVPTLLFVLLCGSAWGQSEIPYGKMLAMGEQELTAKKFKYKPKKNAYVLNKQSSLFTAAEVMAANQGRGLDKAPYPTDYEIIVQMGEGKKPAYVEVIFFSDDTYMQLSDWIKNNTSDYSEVSTGNRTKGHCTYNGYTIELIRQYVPVKLTAENQSSTSTTSANNRNHTTTTTTHTTGGSKTVDGSYNGYWYIIHTGVEATSPNLDKAAEKQKKREEKGKKASIEDLM